MFYLVTQNVTSLDRQVEATQLTTDLDKNLPMYFCKVFLFSVDIMILMLLRRREFLYDAVND